MTNEKNPPAFPMPAFRDEKGEAQRDDILSHDRQPGMTLRDYFAAAAIPALVTQYDAKKMESGDTITASIASEAYALADAMLEHRNKD